MARDRDINEAHETAWRCREAAAAIRHIEAAKAYREWLLENARNAERWGIQQANRRNS